MRKLLLAAVGAASLLLGACGSTESGTITLSLQHLDCHDGDALARAIDIEVTVSGPGMDDITEKGPVDKGSLGLPEIPAGKDRQVTVRATNGAAANATVLAIGRSAKFEVKADKDLAVEVPMVGLNRVHPTASAADPLVCTEPATARAGHSAAALSDGRVLLVGGFAVDQEAGGEQVTYLDGVEMYEPATGGFRSLGNLPSICGDSGTETCERAFAPAVVQKLPNNGGERLLVVGGEYRDGTGALRARGEILKFNPSTEEWTTIRLLHARRHHTATLVANNGLYVIGGFGEPDPGNGTVSVVSESEFLFANSSTMIGAAILPRALHGAAASADGSKLYVAGGVDADGNLPVEVLQTGLPQPPPSSPPQVTALAAGQQLASGVVGPTLAVYWKYLVVAGGHAPDAILDPADPLSGLPLTAGPTGNFFNGKGKIIPLADDLEEQPFPLERERSFACVAPIDANRLLVAGGLSGSGAVVDGGNSAEILAWIDKSQCVPTECADDYQCASRGSTRSSCVGGKCVIACTDDAVCGQKGSCLEGVCQSDLTNPAHRCSGASNGCFPGSACIEGGTFGKAYIGGANPNDSKLETARGWSSCTRLSDDQILITGGVSAAQTRDTLGSPEIYEITHAGR